MVCHRSGVPIAILSRPQLGPPPTPGQLTRRRWDDWRRDRDELGRPAVLIAALYGVHPQAVRAGIRRARALRKEVARVLSA